MARVTCWFVCLLGVVVGADAQAPVSLAPEKPIACDSCEAWNKDREPFKVFGNTYYVGTDGLSSILVTSGLGHILLDGALPQSAALINKHIWALGFRMPDVRLIAGSHEHFDHVGGIAALQRITGAVVAVSPDGARALEAGQPLTEDPQFASFSESIRYPPVKRVRVIADGEVVRAGELTITAHLTPGHAPGGVTWTWRSCEGTRCLDVVYADSLSAVSAPDYRFTDHPDRVEALRKSIDTIGSLPCDVFLSVHPGFARISQKLARRAELPTENPFIDPTACRTYADNARQALNKRLEEGR